MKYYKLISRLTFITFFSFFFNGVQKKKAVLNLIFSGMFDFSDDKKININWISTSK